MAQSAAAAAPVVSKHSKAVWPTFLSRESLASCSLLHSTNMWNTVWFDFTHGHRGDSVHWDAVKWDHRV
jgi:hypothetical protein